MFPKYPHITVQLIGQDGNAFMVLGLCQRAAKQAGLSAEEVKAFMEEVASGDYKHLLRTVTQWFTVE